MFQILEFTEATLATVTNRVEKHGDTDKPAVSLGFEIETGNAILDLIDPKLRPTLYKRHDDQPDLPDVEQVLPVLQCNSIDRVALPTKHEGWTLSVDTDIDIADAMAFGSCKLDKFSVEPKQGGSVVLRFRVGTSDLDAARSGMLGMHVGQPVWITLIAPKPALAAIDGSVEAFNADHPDAGDLFAAGAGPDADEEEDGGDHEGSTPDLEDRLDDALAGSGNWPFPRGDVDAEAPPQSVTATRTPAQSRTARGREKTKAALAAGAEAAK